MKIVILDKNTLGADIDLTPIRNLGKVNEYEASAPDVIAERILDADVVVTNKLKLDASNLGTAKNLKLICVAATGYDNIDTEYCKSQNIALCNVPGYSTDSVAQLSVSAALSLATHLTEYKRCVSSGDYTKQGVANRLVPVYHEVSSFKWGVVGGGGIGTRVAQIAEALGCKVMVCRRKKEGRFPIADIDVICRECDIISLHVPLTDSTRGLISRERIASMKKGAILVNTARGAVCDEEALAEAVLDKRIALGCDVYSVEPFDKSHPFNKILDCDNALLTPHMAWGAAESRARCVEMIAQNITAFSNGIEKNRVV